MDNFGKPWGIQTAGEKMMMERRLILADTRLSHRRIHGGGRMWGKGASLPPPPGGKPCGRGITASDGATPGGGGVGVDPADRWGGEGKA